MPSWGWRAVFFVGVLPALFTLWIRRNVEEPPMWQSRARRRPRAVAFSTLFRPGLAPARRSRLR